MNDKVMITYLIIMGIVLIGCLFGATVTSIDKSINFTGYYEITYLQKGDSIIHKDTVEIFTSKPLTEIKYNKR